MRRWIVRRALARSSGLLYVAPDGRVAELGAVSAAELEALSWAWGVAYRGARGGERSRLARSRDAAARVGRASRLLKEVELRGVQAPDDLVQ